MPERHLEVEEIRQLLSSDLSTSDERSVRRHLFACAECEERISSAFEESPSEPGDPPAPARAAEPVRWARTRAGDAGLGALRHSLAVERLAAEAQMRSVLGEGIARAKSLVARDRTFQTWGFFERLLAEAQLLIASEPHRTRAFLHLALRIATQLDSGRYGESAVATAQTRGWAYLGNARRVLGDLEGAEKAFRRAEFHFRQSHLDPMDEALLVHFRASLRLDQRRFADALALLEEALAVYREIGDDHHIGRVLMTRGLSLLYGGEPEKAAESYRESLVLFDEVRDSRLRFCCCKDLLYCLSEAGRAAEAATLLPEVKALATEVGAGLDLVRLRWIEGRIAAALGRAGEAESAYRATQDELLAARLPYDAALVTLDLAALLLQQGRGNEARSLAEEMLPIFQARQIHREALAALAVFQRAAEMDGLTVALLKETASRIRSASAPPAVPST
jgi:tetratricopeptide (TPR) repeat protein